MSHSDEGFQPDSPELRISTIGDHTLHQTIKTTPQGPLRHEEYYFEDGNAVFLVGNTLFNVHRSFFCRDPESAFTSMFDIPTEPEKVAQGSSDDDPIVIPSVNDNDFAHFIYAVYSTAFTAKIDFEVLPIPNLLPVVELADRFCIETLVRIVSNTIAQTIIGAHNAVDLLSIAMRYSLSCARNDRKMLFRYLCQREAPLNTTEALRLGAATVGLIGRAREKLLRTQGGSLTRSQNLNANPNLFQPTTTRPANQNQNQNPYVALDEFSAELQTLVGVY